MRTQVDRILARLEDGPLCSFEPLRWDPPISRTAARINDLRDDGWIIDTEPCRVHVHTGRAVQYTLVYRNVPPAPIVTFGEVRYFWTGVVSDA